MKRRFLPIAFLGLFVAAGCGGGKAGGPGAEDRARIRELVGSFEDLANRPKEFGANFVSGKPTAAPQKYVGNGFYLVDAPNITGETATAKVAVKRINTGAWLGEANWEFAKTGETWKVKSGPVP